MTKQAVKRLGYGLLLFGIGVATGCKFDIPSWFTVVYPTLVVVWLIAWDEVKIMQHQKQQEEKYPWTEWEESDC